MTQNASSLIDFAKNLLSSLKNREEILRLLITKLIEDFEVEHGSVWSVEGSYVIPLFSLNWEGVEDEISVAIRDLRIPIGEGYVGQAAQKGVPNFDNAPQKAAGHFQRVDEATQHKTVNIISIPLNKGTKTIGVIQLLDRRGSQPFSNEDQDILMQHYAPWATIALDNANLYKELEDTTLFGKQLLSSLDREEVLRHLISRLIEEFRVERGSVWSVEGDFVIPLFSLNKDGHEDEISYAIRNLRIPLGKGYVGLSAQNGTPSLNNSPHLDSDHYKKVDHATQHITKNIISIPLIRKGKTIGVIQLLDRLDNIPFSIEDQHRLTSHYAPWATIALDNANLYTELTELTEDTVHNMGNVLGSARTKLYFLEQDLNNFVNSITQNIISFDKEVRESLNSVDDNLGRSVKLVRAQVEAYRGGAKEITSPNQLIKEAVQQLATQDDISIQIDIPDDLPELRVNKQTTIVHLFELLTNATKAVREGLISGLITRGMISITGLQNNNFIELRFTNNGNDISKANWEVIFEKHKSLKKSPEGKSFGLGLWGARKYLERQGGSIKVERSGKGTTTFLVCLPLPND